MVQSSHATIILMSKDIIYTILSGGSGREFMLDALVYSNGGLYDLSFDSNTEGMFKKWTISKRNIICKIDDENRILEELSAKSELHSFASRGCRLLRIGLVPGEYHSRVWRPLFVRDESSFSRSAESDIKKVTAELRQVKTYLPYNLEVELSGVTQLSLLVEQLKVICKTIHPTQNNLQTYGHELRNLLILACTEVEAQLRGIYEANAKKKRNLNMEDDYFMLNTPLKLYGYTLSYTFYPSLKSSTPFDAWASQKYQPLPWYQAYNAVKHNRESKFDQASLGNVLEAISAVAILLIAQYGERAFYWKDLIGQFFNFEEKPEWNNSEMYLPPYKDSDWKKVKMLNR